MMSEGDKNLTLWQQAMQEKNQEQELYNFLSIGCGGRCKSRSRKLYLALQKKKEIKLCRRQVIKIMRGIGLDRGFSRKIARLLEKSGLSLSQQRSLARQIRKILLDFKRDLHRQIDLSKINLMQLPLSLRRFLVALLVLKAEIANLFRLRCEADLQRIKDEDLRLSKTNKEIGLGSMSLNIDNHKSCTTGVSLTKGVYDGMIFDLNRNNKTQYDCYEDRNINYQNEMSKNNRNMSDDNQKNSSKYSSDDKNINFVLNTSKNNAVEIVDYDKHLNDHVNYGFDTTKVDRNKADNIQKSETKYYKDEKQAKIMDSDITKKEFYQEKAIQTNMEN